MSERTPSARKKNRTIKIIYPTYKIISRMHKLIGGRGWLGFFWSFFVVVVFYLSR